MWGILYIVYIVDSQYGFRSGHGCTDMVFCIRQLVEKAIEHNNKVSFFFDLGKANDTVPQSRSASYVVNLAKIWYSGCDD